MRRSADKMDFKRLRIHPLLSKPCTESGNEAQNIQSALDDATSQQILFKRKKKGYLYFGDSDRYAIDRDLAKRDKLPIKSIVASPSAALKFQGHHSLPQTITTLGISFRCRLPIFLRVPRPAPIVFASIQNRPRHRQRGVPAG
jgi:hypothetical protein